MRPVSSQSVSGERILSRKLARTLDYSAFFADPERARKGLFSIREIAGKTTCTANNDEDEH